MNLRIIFWRRVSFDGARTKSHRNNQEATGRCWEVGRDTWTVPELQKPWSKRNTLTQSEAVKDDVIMLKPDRKELCSLHTRGLVIMLHFFMADICILPFLLLIIGEVLLSFIRGCCIKSFNPMLHLEARQATDILTLWGKKLFRASSFSPNLRFQPSKWYSQKSYGKWRERLPWQPSVIPRLQCP